MLRKKNAKNLINNFSILGLVFFAFFGPLNIIQGYIITGYLEVFCVALIIIILLINRANYFDLAGNLILMLLVAVFTSQLITGGLFGSALLWMFVFPLLSFFLKGPIKGAAWNVLMFFVCCVIFIVDRTYNASIFPFSNGNFAMFVASYLAVSILLYIHESIFDKANLLINSQIESLKMYALVMNNVSQHIIITDIDGVVIYANPAVTKLTGYDLKEVVGSKPSLWGRQMSAGFYEKLWKKIKVDKETFAGEIINKRKNGELYTASAIISPVFDEKNDLKYFAGIENDISDKISLEKNLVQQKTDLEKKSKAIMNLLEDIEYEKDQVEKVVVDRTRELRDEKSRLLASINTLSFGYVLSDANHKIILKNKTIVDLVGPRANSVDSVEEIAKILSEERDILSEIKKCHIKDSECEIGDIVYDKKVLRGILSPIKSADASKEKIGYVFILENITEAKVVERSREEFFAVASHELRTPLTAIRGNMEMLRDFGTTLKADEKLSMINDAYEGTSRLIRIVNDFLDISRLEQGRITFKKEVFAMEEVITNVISKIEALVKEKKLKLIINLPKKALPKVFGDPDRVIQVLFNLIGNAVTYTEKGSITIDAEIVGKFLAVSVVDTGKGINSENQVLLFRKFQQAGAKILTRDATSGTGLGLYIAKHIMEGMGGSIALVNSEPGKGSNFRFTLPLAPK